MAMTILPQQKGDWNEALSGLGKGFGSSVGSALEGLANRKLKEVSGRAKSTRLRKAFPNITQEQADLIQDFEGNPETQRHLLKVFSSSSSGGDPEEYDQEAKRYIDPSNTNPQPRVEGSNQQSFEQAEQQRGEQQGQQQLPQNMDEVLNKFFPLRTAQQNGQQGGLAALQGMGPQEEPAIQKQRQLQNEQLSLATQANAQKIQPQKEAIGGEIPDKIARSQEKIQKAADAKKKAIAEAWMSPQELAASRKSESAEKAAAIKAESAERIKKWEYSKDLIQKSDAERRNARNKLEDLQRFEELETEGEGLDTPGYVEFLKRSGLDIPALMNAESEEFQKIAANFLSGAKEAFGGRVSNYEVEQFLKTIPSLSQSPEGRKRVIANLKRMYRGQVSYADAKDKIIKENKGEPPFGLGAAIDERLDESMAKNAEAFRKDLARPVPKGQNKFITALGAVAGNVAGSAGKLAKGAAGAALGANIGKAAGPWGAVGGGVLGGLGGLSGLI